MWALLILYTLLFKKHYILKCVPVLTFGKKETVPVVQFETKNQPGEFTEMKTETLNELKHFKLCVFAHVCGSFNLSLCQTLPQTHSHTYMAICISIFLVQNIPCNQTFILKIITPH